mmetsp:Transcript_48899/g.95590  ORF Transcript_48899/g.95590 Transcript_48899/m.95590 type:complete len:221 (+) Transcript_48899:454-1116(+)
MPPPTPPPRRDPRCRNRTPPPRARWDRARPSLPRGGAGSADRPHRWRTTARLRVPTATTTRPDRYTRRATIRVFPRDGRRPGAAERATGTTPTGPRGATAGPPSRSPRGTCGGAPRTPTSRPGPPRAPRPFPGITTTRARTWRPSRSELAGCPSPFPWMRTRWVGGGRAGGAWENGAAAAPRPSPPQPIHGMGILPMRNDTEILMWEPLSSTFIRRGIRE